MTKEMEFFIYLLEHYASYKNVSADWVLTTWNKRGLTQYFFDMYERYHSEAIENAFIDIDAKMAEKV